MRKLFLLVSVVALAFSANAQKIDTLRGDITGSRTLDADTLYVLDGFVFVTSTGELVIPKGTIIKGLLASEVTDGSGLSGGLVVSRGGKLVAKGTKSDPIVFTSNRAAGSRVRGDWAGFVFLGNAENNDVSGEIVYEGRTDDAFRFGNTLFAKADGQNYDAADGDPFGDGRTNAEARQDFRNENSGLVRFVRFEFAGFPFEANREINVCTFGSVGRLTQTLYLQASYGDDDAFEQFGGQVDSRFNVAYNTNDDDFDADRGYNGRNQFANVIRGYRADVSGSEGFESDNDGSGSSNIPVTRPIYSNFSVWGPGAIQRLGAGNTLQDYVVDAVDPLFNRGARIRRNSSAQIYNSVLAGWPDGAYDCQSCNSNARLRRTALVGPTLGGADLLLTPPPSAVAIDSLPASVRALGIIDPLGRRQANSDPFNESYAVAPTFQLFAGSLLNNGQGSSPDATYGEATLNGFRPDPAIGSHITGGVPGAGWSNTWEEFDPVNAAYNIPPATTLNQEDFSLDAGVDVFPNPVLSGYNTNVTYELKQASKVQIQVIDALSGATVRQFAPSSVLAAGKYQNKVATEGLRPGIYVIKVVSDKSSVTSRFAIN